MLQILNERRIAHGETTTLLEASSRWLVNHSKLIDNDGIIIGYSKVEQFDTNLDSLSGGPLHPDIVDAFDDAWNNIKTNCPNYFR